MDIDVSLILQSLGTVRKFADPEGPLAGRKLAAGGALPLPPEQATQVLFCLTFDPDAEVQAKAKQSLDELPDHVLDVALQAPVHCGVLEHFAQRFRENTGMLEKIALNPATSDETFCMLAGLPQPRVIEIVSHYQTRLLRCPQLVEALSENPIASGATLDRVLEFLGISTTSPAPAEEAEAPVVEEPLANTAADGAEAFDPEDTSEIPEELLVDREDEGEEDEQQMQSLFSQVQKMNVLEKIKLARFGNAESRSLLVRDRNKIVATAAIRSPKIKESEVVAFAKSRNLSDEVLRIIANTQEWTKGYQVKHAIVTNPKAPLAAALKFVNHLTDRDLKGVMRSREVPGQVCIQARRILERKGKI